LTEKLIHHPVLLHEALDQLKIRPEGIYIDCTFGRGGHTTEILKKLGKDGKLVALDRDLDAIISPEAKNLSLDPRLSLFHSCFSKFEAVIKRLDYHGRVDGVLIDLGVSSPQLDNPKRGFSFLKEGPLDMRMDNTQGFSASEYLAEVNENELAKVIFEYGEDRFARRIAKAIVIARQTQPILTTLELSKLIEGCVPFKERYKHPATRTFQAIRIVVNQELEEIKLGLKQIAEALAPGGRLVVIAFHSLEDRIVKRFMREESGRKNNPGKLPILESEIQFGQLKRLGKPIRANPSEVRQNPRARSAVMRVAEKI
jgi:16S rRNA (cytosine1402-N4)-methyltransferase